VPSEAALPKASSTGAMAVTSCCGIDWAAGSALDGLSLSTINKSAIWLNGAQAVTVRAKIINRVGIKSIFVDFVFFIGIDLQINLFIAVIIIHNSSADVLMGN
jgi:hypothetical protein